MRGKAVKLIEVFSMFSRDVLIMLTMIIVYVVLKHLRYKLSTFYFLFYL